MTNTRGLYLRGHIWWVCYTDEDGKTRRVSSRTSSKREAAYILACRRAEVYEAKRLKSSPLYDRALKLLPRIKDILQLARIED